MSTAFIDFRAFESVAAAESTLGDLLRESDIQYNIHTVKKEVAVYTGSGDSLMNVWMQIHAADFERVNRLLEEYAYQSVSLDKKHFLNSFTDAELQDLLYRFDEWSAEEYVMARKILDSRHSPVSDADISALRIKRLADISEPKEAETWVLYLGFALVVLGGFFSVMIGWSFYSATKTDPEGKKLYVYNKSARIAGKFMMIAGVAAFVLYAILLVCIRS